MFKKRPVLLLLVVGVLTFYSVMSYYSEVAVLRDNYASIVLYKERNVKMLLSLARNLGETQMWDDLHSRLEDARQHEFLDFYVLKFKDKSVWMGSYDGKTDLSKLDDSYIEGPVISPDLSYQTLAFPSGYRLTIGIGKNADAYVERNMPMFRPILFQEAVLCALIVLAVALWAFRDMFQILRKIRTGGLADIGKIKTKSTETDLFARGLQGYFDEVQDLQSRNALLNRQVLPALKRELSSGRHPPYSFSCTMVRTDINNFSTIYNTCDTAALFAVINDYFTEVTHILSRYKGFVSEFVGDEVIYYFKDEDHEQSFSVALSAIRDIHLAADSFNERTRRELGFGFTVKSSLAHGPLHFGQLVDGFSLGGSILIETVRILSHVTEKDENATYFEKRCLPMVDRSFATEELSSVILKGFQEQKILYAVRENESCEKLLKTLSLDTVANLKFHRGDQDLISIFAFLEKKENLDEALFKRVVGILRLVKVTQSSPEMQKAFWRLVESYKKSCESVSDEKMWRRFASLITVISNLIPFETSDVQVKNEAAERLRAYAMLGHGRVVANSLDALTHLKVKLDTSLIRALQLHEDHRISANAILLEGILDLNEGVVQKLKAALHSKQPLAVSSALYAIGELASYHQADNLVFYRTQIRFLSLVEELKGFADHEDESVRRQARGATLKLAA
jgi:class 3 adenylate cyclase